MLVAFNDCIIPDDGFANNSNFQAYQCFDIHIITIIVCGMCLPLQIYNIIYVIHDTLLHIAVEN